MIPRGCPTVGIDLGTTFSALAYTDASGLPRMFCDAQGRSLVPSVIRFTDQGCEVGEPEFSDRHADPQQVARFIKAQIGTGWRKIYGGHVYSAESLSAMVLRALVGAAEPELGPIQKAVITVPAYFTERRRLATQQAGEVAGLEVAATLNEPLAATLSFCLGRAIREETVLVYDLGGGTFDVTIVRFAPDLVEELATNGNLELGGRNWDQILVNLVAEELHKVQGYDVAADPLALERLRQLCEVAKRSLSRQKAATITVPVGGKAHSVVVTRDQFQDRSAALLQATRMTAELALEDAGLSWSDLSRVVLVGGATQMPAVRDLLGRLAPSRVDTSVNPVAAVALGAALYAQHLERGQHLNLHALPPAEEPPAECLSPSTEPPAIQASTGQGAARAPSGADADQARHTSSVPLQAADDLPATKTAPQSGPRVFGEQQPQIRFVTAHGIGVKVRNAHGWANTVLIPRNTPVPARVTRRFLTAAPSTRETFVHVDITQGDTPDIQAVEELGTGYIDGFPPHLPAGQAVTVSMQFDEQGRLRISAVHDDTGLAMHMSLEVPGSLTSREVQQQRTHLRQNVKLKIVNALPTDGDADDEDLSDLTPALLQAGRSARQMRSPDQRGASPTSSDRSGDSRGAPQPE